MTTGVAGLASADDSKLAVCRWHGATPSFAEVCDVFDRLEAVAVQWCQTPGHVFEEHMHLEPQVLCLIAGSLSVLTTEGEEVSLGPGDIVRVPAFVRHTTVVGEDGAVCLEAHDGPELTRPDDT